MIPFSIGGKKKIAFLKLKILSIIFFNEYLIKCHENWYSYRTQCVEFSDAVAISKFERGIEKNAKNFVKLKFHDISQHTWANKWAENQKISSKS